MKKKKKLVNPDKQKIKAIILDMDGVVTQTASTHAYTWEQLFGKYNRFRKNNGLGEFQPFDRDTDYLPLLDGKSRYDGIKSFLNSRKIHLPEGSPDDTPGYKTICALGNLKNELFHQYIKEQGVQTYQDTIDAIKYWKKSGLKIGLISASKNCRFIIKKAGLYSLFDVCVDGTIAENMKLKGKPNPDIFLEAAEKMGVEPAEIAIFEDSLAGVEAGKSGNFGQVIGVARNNSDKELKLRGADLVINSFNSVDRTLLNFAPYNNLPSGIDQFDVIENEVGNKQVFLFLDYDGTLTPIVKHPEDALLSEKMRGLIKELADTIQVAIISGRDLKDIRQMVGLDNVYYAGSHGFEISGPDDFYFEYKKGNEFIPELDKAEKQLRTELQNIRGIQIERKHFAIAIHYRNVSKDKVPPVKQKITEILKGYPKLKKGEGKKILEFKPNIDWNKGKAIQWLFDKLIQGQKNGYPIYIGDDITDEDAFRQLRKMRGKGILVGDHGEKTYANFQLKDVNEVKGWLRKSLRKQYKNGFLETHL